MREIKFRAWDKELNFMINIKRYKIDFDGQVLFDNNDKELYNQTNKIELMQYTGLKDAINKSEVYEHDIINFLGVGFLKVEWDYKHTGWICLDKHYKKRNLADVLLNGGIRVGNIYENPELLKEGN